MKLGYNQLPEKGDLDLDDEDEEDQEEKNMINGIDGN